MTAIGKEWLAALSSKLGSRSGKHSTARGSCVGSIDAAVAPGAARSLSFGFLLGSVTGRLPALQESLYRGLSGYFHRPASTIPSVADIWRVHPQWVARLHSVDDSSVTGPRFIPGAIAIQFAVIGSAQDHGLEQDWVIESET